MIRTLRPDEPVPEGEPRRYKNANGYMRLRWRLGPGEYVECYEHRFAMGLPEGREVHHVNRHRDDNDSANLEALTPAEHAAEHAPAWVEAGVQLYAAGRTCDDIAKMAGIGAPAVYRALARRGVRFRTQAEWRRSGIDQEELERLSRDEGLTRHEIADLVGLSYGQVRNTLRDRGVPSLGRSRPKGDDAAFRKARKAVRDRSGGMCEAGIQGVCTGRAQHVHHLTLRSQGGGHDPEGLLDSCLACHGHIHANPAESYEQGWLRHGGAS